VVIAVHGKASHLANVRKAHFAVDVRAIITFLHNISQFEKLTIVDDRTYQFIRMAIFITNEDLLVFQERYA